MSAAAPSLDHLRALQVLGCCVGTVPPVTADDLVVKPVPTADAVLLNSRAMWRDFWERGGELFDAVVYSIPSGFQSHPSRSFLTNNAFCCTAAFGVITYRLVVVVSVRRYGKRDV